MELKKEVLNNISGGDDTGIHEIGVQREPTEPKPEVPPTPDSTLPSQQFDPTLFLSLKCPKCGNTVSFELLELSGEHKHVRCIACNHEFSS